MTTRLVRLLLLVVGLQVVLTGCSLAQRHPEKNYSDFYDVSVFVPQHYDVWAENLILYNPDRVWMDPMGGIGCCWKTLGSMGEMDVMPHQILVRWFSYAEQKSYAKLVEIPDPEQLWQRMHEPISYKYRGKIRSEPRSTLGIGLAPGGVIVLWIMNMPENAVEVARFQAVEVQAHPERFKETLEAYQKENGAYLKEHGIPYGSW